MLRSPLQSAGARSYTGSTRLMCRQHALSRVLCVNDTLGGYGGNGFHIEEQSNREKQPRNTRKTRKRLSSATGPLRLNVFFFVIFLIFVVFVASRACSA